MQKPVLLLEVEQALAAANKAQAELEEFDRAHPNLGADLAGQTARLEHIKEALWHEPKLHMDVEVLIALSNADTYQQRVVAPLRKLQDERTELFLRGQWADRAYVHASHKWDSSAERLDYLLGQGLLALSQRKE